MPPLSLILRGERLVCEVDMAPFPIEEGIKPLVEALNLLPYAATVYSCEGHFEGPANDKFLPTAYVTFGVDDPARFRPLYESFLDLAGRFQGGSIRLTYDCILGRYTLSAWADASLKEAKGRREEVIALVRGLSEVVRKEAAVAGAEPNAMAGNVRYPCRQAIRPCALIIPPRPIICPFEDTPPDESTCCYDC